MDMALVKRVVLLVVVLATLMDMKHQAQAWRPQGRFGKRMSPLDQAELAEEVDAMRSYGALGDSSSLQDPELPVFRSGDIFCLRKGNGGMYRCLRFSKPLLEGPVE